MSLEPGFSDPGPAGDGGGTQAAWDRVEKAHRVPGRRNTKSVLSLPRGAAGVGTLTCAEKSPRDSLCPSGLWGAKWGFVAGETKPGQGTLPWVLEVRGKERKSPSSTSLMLLGI